jgi:hypothetical protein
MRPPYQDLSTAIAAMQELREQLGRRRGVVRAGRDAARKLDTFETILVGPLAVPRTFRAFYTVFDHIDGVAVALSAIARVLKRQKQAGKPLRAPLAPGRELILPDASYDGRLAGGEMFLAYVRAASK